MGVPAVRDYSEVRADPDGSPREARAIGSIRSPNHLLASLPSADFELIRPHLRPAELVHGAVLVEAGRQITRAYFPHSGVISLVVSLRDGEMIEVAMIGQDSVFGASAAFNGRTSLNDAIVRVPGIASILDIEHIWNAADVSASFRSLLFRHKQVLFAQAQQSAACNACHTVESRLSRCLLRLRDLSGSDKLPITQEALAQMIGVGRNSVSIVAHTLQQADLIRYSRGNIEIINLQRLKRSACECYTTVKLHYDRLMSSEN